MWRDVFLNNREAVLEVLGRFNEDLSRCSGRCAMATARPLFDLFTRTRAIRRAIVDIGQDTAAPNFGRDNALDQSPRSAGRRDQRNTAFRGDQIAEHGQKTAPAAEF